MLLLSIWRHSQVVRQRSAKPLSPVQIWVAPPKMGCRTISIVRQPPNFPLARGKLEPFAWFSTDWNGHSIDRVSIEWPFHITFLYLAEDQGKLVYPMSDSSTSRAAERPSCTAHTTRDCPRRISPAANTPGTLVS